MNPINKILKDSSLNRELVHYVKCPKCKNILEIRKMYPGLVCKHCGNKMHNPYWKEYNDSQRWEIFVGEIK